jgi:hypothetical protein
VVDLLLESSFGLRELSGLAVGCLMLSACFFLDEIKFPAEDLRFFQLFLKLSDLFDGARRSCEGNLTIFRA